VSSEHLPRRLLGVWAHPDDETYLSAALMRRVVTSGGHVTVVSATRGELGGEPVVTGPTLGAQRERELVEAMSQLGVHDVRLLDHADGSCADADPQAAAADLVAIIRSVAPDTIVTFGPDGITRHPDHVAVGAWTTLAVAALPPARPRLLYATMTREFVERHRRSYPDLPLTVAGQPAVVESDSLAVRVEPSAAERRHKRAALMAHASQVAPLVALLGAERLHDWWIDETFRTPTIADIESHLVSMTSPSALQASRSVLVHSGATSDHTGDRPIENRNER
jgi:LmbE family N-acetylglucosaminyl deacetylase